MELDCFCFLRGLSYFWASAAGGFSSCAKDASRLAFFSLHYSCISSKWLFASPAVWLCTNVQIWNNLSRRGDVVSHWKQSSFLHLCEKSNLSCHVCRAESRNINPVKKKKKQKKGISIWFCEPEVAAITTSRTTAPPAVPSLLSSDTTSTNAKCHMVLLGTGKMPVSLPRGRMFLYSVYFSHLFTLYQSRCWRKPGLWRAAWVELQVTLQYCWNWI